MLEDAKLDDNSMDYSSERDDPKAWGTSFSIGGKTYAASLFWQPLQNRDDPYTEIKEAAENVLEGADLFCLKPGKSPQFGLCISYQGYTKKTPAAAVSVATALSDRSSFLAVFKVSNGWWYVCARNDIILSDGDMLFLNEEDAKEQFMSMLAVPDWGRKIAPAEWLIEETENINIASLLDRGADAKLQKIHALRGGKLFAVVVAVGIVVAWLGYTLIDSVLLAPPPKPIIAPVPIKKIEKAPPPPEPKPWENIDDPKGVMLQCFKATQDVVGIVTPGWKIEGITCTSNGLVTSWRRETGRITWIDKALSTSGVTFSSKSIAPNGTNVIVSVPIENVKQINSPPDKNAVDLVNTINDLFQAIQMPISLNNETWTSPQKNVYKSIKFSFTSNHDPAQWLDLLMKFSGLKITTIKYDINSRNWYYEGAIYVL
ncbi:MAG: type 4b pilus protein PilO2 [Alphaproteobacteria bacterium]|nr:type 4b pilus protein PilO2 [Alphaproteobacteria bacterium]